MKNKMRIVMLVLLPVLMLFIVGCSGKQEETQETAVAVRTIKPINRDLVDRLSYLGTVHARSEIKVIAQVQGTVQSLPFAEGSRIKKGDILARLYAPELEAAVQRLQAERDYWQRRHNSDIRLLEQKAIPEDQEQSSRRASASAEAAFRETNSRLQKTVEIAAFSGTVLKWYVEAGQNVMPGQPLLLIGDAKSEIHADVVEDDVKRGLQKGTSVHIKNGQDYYYGKIVEIAPMANTISRTMLVKIHLDDDTGFNAAVGSSAAIDFVLNVQQQALAVPGSAIVDRLAKPHIYLIRENRAFKQPVKTGTEDNGWVAVDFQWNGQDAVAVTNLNALADSASVFAVPDKESVQ